MRLAVAPRVRIAPCGVEGTIDYVRFLKRPRISVSFFVPAAGQPRPDDPAGLAARLLEEIRAHAPPVPAGRRYGS